MKFLRTLLFIIAVLVILFIVLGFLGPKTYDVSRTIEIDAPRELVYNQVSSLTAQNEWGPWAEEDPDMVTTYHGPDGVVGSYSHWDGEVAGEGEQKLITLEENTKVETELRFIKPYESISNGYFNLSDTDNRTKLEWGIRGDNAFMQRAMAMIPGLSVDDFVGPMFEKGLQNLKKMTEDMAISGAASKSALETLDYDFEMTDRPASTYVVKRAVVPTAGIQDFYATNLGGIFTALGASGNEPIGMPMGIYYSWDEKKGEADMCAAAQVADPNVRIEGYETITLPASKVVKVDYYGAYEGIGSAHEALDTYINANNLEVNGPCMEQYVTDPSAEPDPNKWLTKVYYHVK